MRERVGPGARLLRWFDRNRRDLPWRRDRTPYSVLVAEAMLQQTTAAAVAPYYRRFLERFPDWASLAAADSDDVLAAWAGLGYYRRARSLQAAAREVVSWGGDLPKDLAAVVALPGIGPYTAGAVLSIAHGMRLPAVDGNVARVLSRLSGVSLDPSRPAQRRALEAMALELMPAGRPGDFNEALMDLGAATCTPRSPACGGCPLRSGCRARIMGRQADIPLKAARPASSAVTAAAALIRRGDRVLLRRRARTEALMPGLWELPGGFTEGRAAGEFLERFVLPGLGGGSAGPELARIRHVITRRRITLHVHECELDAVPAAQGLRWEPSSAAEALGLTAATRKALALLGGLDPSAPGRRQPRT